MPEIIAGAFFVLNKNSSSDITRNISSVWKKVRFSLVLDEGSRPTKVWKMLLTFCHYVRLFKCILINEYTDNHSVIAYELKLFKNFQAKICFLMKLTISFSI